LRGRDDLTFDAVIPEIRQAVGIDLTFHGCRWFSTYRIQHRAASRFRDRRCFLLGDAAHIHSPMGAQGMNTGLQDSYNLAWKLARVVKGEADATLLDSYEAERMPVAQNLLRSTDRLFRLVVADTWLAALFRTRILAVIAAFAMGRKRVQRLAFRAISQIGIQYRNSPLSRTLPGVSAEAPQAGDRFPWMQLKLREGGPVEDLFDTLDDTRFNLLVIGQPQAAGGGRKFGDLLDTHVIPADPANEKVLAQSQVAAPCFYLLRPDGHVALAGIHLEEPTMARYFSASHILAGRRVEQRDPSAEANPAATMLLPAHAWPVRE
jgi:hypothetical protein